MNVLEANKITKRVGAAFLIIFVPLVVIWIWPFQSVICNGDWLNIKTDEKDGSAQVEFRYREPLWVFDDAEIQLGTDVPEKLTSAIVRRTEVIGFSLSKDLRSIQWRLAREDGTLVAEFADAIETDYAFHGHCSKASPE